MKKTSFIIWLTSLTIIGIFLAYLGLKFNDLPTTLNVFLVFLNIFYVYFLLNINNKQ